MKRTLGNGVVPAAASVIACVILALYTAFPGLPARAGAPDRSGEKVVRVIAFGAHPDDCEIKVGGAGALWAREGHKVQFVSVTNGDIGHWKIAGGPLAKRRAEEVRRADELLGVTSLVLDIHDGEVMPTLENRKTITRLIRKWRADIVLTHRPNDYHPDHRYTGILVQDSAYMVTVPFFCPDTPALRRNPVFLYVFDRFQRPNPFQPDIVVAIDDVIEKKLAAMDAIESQFFEGGCGGNADLVPRDEEGRARRRREVRERFRARFARVADRFRDRLIELYGPERGRRIRYAEAFEICEYGRKPSPAELRRLFPFLPAGSR